MRARQLDPTRRALLMRSVKVVALATLTAEVGRSGLAAAKAAKGDFMYQDHQHDGRSCSQCKFFSPDRQNPRIGSCSVVAGAISRDGWCAAFSAKAFP